MKWTCGLTARMLNCCSPLKSVGNGERLTKGKHEKCSLFLGLTVTAIWSFQIQGKKSKLRKKMMMKNCLMILGKMKKLMTSELGGRRRSSFMEEMREAWM